MVWRCSRSFPIAYWKFAGGYENAMFAATAEKRPARRCATAAKEERQSTPIAFYDSEQCEVAQE